MIFASQKKSFNVLKHAHVIAWLKKEPRFEIYFDSIVTSNLHYPGNFSEIKAHCSHYISRLKAFCRKAVLKNFAKFLGKHLYQSLVWINLQLRPVALLKRRFWRRYFPVDFAKFLRASICIHRFETSPYSTKLWKYYVFQWLYQSCQIHWLSHVNEYLTILKTFLCCFYFLIRNCFVKKVMIILLGKIRLFWINSNT